MKVAPLDALILVDGTKTKTVLVGDTVVEVEIKSIKKVKLAFEGE